MKPPTPEVENLIREGFRKREVVLLARDAKLRLFQQLHQDDEPEWYRAAGACRCSFCGLEYREHLDSVDGFDKRLCNAEVVHL